MKKQIAVLIVMVSLIGGCAFAPKFTPTTMKGAECKRECALGQQSCHASSYNRHHNHVPPEYAQRCVLLYDVAF